MSPQRKGTAMAASTDLTRRSFIGAAALGACATAAASVSAGQGATTAQAAEPAAGLNPQVEDFTGCTTDFAPLFEPLQIGPLTLRNRIVKSPAGSDTWSADECAETGVLNANFLDYYETLAKGGAALVFMETAISKLISVKIDEEGRHTGGWLLEDMSTIGEKLAPLTERIHAQGAYAGIQLAAGSADVATCTVEDLKWLQDTMVQIAAGYKAAGFDIIELHSSATQFMKNMLTGRINTREDEYGAQSVENRTRFTCETIRAIKAELGEDFPLQILMDAVEDNDSLIGDYDQYITIEDSVQNALAFEAAGADTFYLRLSVPGKHVSQFAPDLMFSGYKSEGITGFGTRFDFSQHFGGMVESEYSGAAMLLKCAAEFKKSVSKPVSCAGCMDPRLAPDLICGAIADGQVDYLMMTRELTVDPELPIKLQEGRRDEVAPCCHCLHCHNKGGNPLYTRDKGAEYCRVNAVTQLAYTDAMPEGYELPAAEVAKKVVVVGGGVGGMEAARIAAKRGHTVTLFEKDSELGGLVRTARAFKGEHERLGDLIAYLTRQLELAGVNVVTGVEADAATVAAEGPDAVVVAVGGQRTVTLAPNEKPVYDFDQIPTADLGERVIILGAGAQAVDCALWLVAQGKKVQMVHGAPQSEVGKEQSMWVRTYVIPHLTSQGVKIWNSCTIEGVSEEGLSIAMASGVQKLLPCDSIIDLQDMVPNTALADELAASYDVYPVGDCASPWNIGLAIRSGNLAARKI